MAPVAELYSCYPTSSTCRLQAPGAHLQSLSRQRPAYVQVILHPHEVDTARTAPIRSGFRTLARAAHELVGRRSTGSLSAHGQLEHRGRGHDWFERKAMSLCACQWWDGRGDQPVSVEEPRVLPAIGGGRAPATQPIRRSHRSSAHLASWSWDAVSERMGSRTSTSEPQQKARISSH